MSQKLYIYIYSVLLHSAKILINLVP